MSAPYLGREQEIIARTAWAEARGDDDLATPQREGMEAVCSVLGNRARLGAAHVAQFGRPHPLYGDGTPAGAALVPFQFSCWKGWDRREPLPSLPPERLSDQAYQAAVGIAAKACAGELPDTVNGATHYCTIARPDDLDARKPWPPSWTAGRPIVARTPQHLFYNLGPVG
jgi:hypothetical protein